MCSCDQLRKLVAQVRPVGRMSLEPCFTWLQFNIDILHKIRFIYSSLLKSPHDGMRTVIQYVM